MILNIHTIIEDKVFSIATDNSTPKIDDWVLTKNNEVVRGGYNPNGKVILATNNLILDNLPTFDIIEKTTFTLKELEMARDFGKRHGDILWNELFVNPLKYYNLSSIDVVNKITDIDDLSDNDYNELYSIYENHITFDDYEDEDEDWNVGIYSWALNEGLEHFNKYKKPYVLNGKLVVKKYNYNG